MYATNRFYVKHTSTGKYLLGALAYVNNALVHPPKEFTYTEAKREAERMGSGWIVTYNL